MECIRIHNPISYLIKYSKNAIVAANTYNRLYKHIIKTILLKLQLFVVPCRRNVKNTRVFINQHIITSKLNEK